MTIALELTGVRAGYGTAPVLHGIDLVVPKGKAVALLGANGAGKTTALKVAGGLLPPSTGDIRLWGEPVTRLREHARARLGMTFIPEGHSIFRQLSVRENLAMYVGGKGVAEAVDRAASIFPILGERLSQEAGTLSGGQQQMLALCRALVTDKQLILADELSVGLAPVIVDEIFAAVELLLAEGRSLLIVEQYVSRVLTLADYVYILNKGRVVFVGEPSQCHDTHVFEQYLGSVA